MLGALYAFSGRRRNIVAIALLYAILVIVAAVLANVAAGAAAALSVGVLGCAGLLILAIAVACAVCQFPDLLRRIEHTRRNGRAVPLDPRGELG